jgi:TPR repeat protein
MEKQSQTNLRPGMGFDAPAAARQSDRMRLMLYALLLGIVAPTLFGARPMRWANTQLLRTAAEKGDAEAQYLLGLQYREGDGLDRSQAEAEKWFRRAAETGHVEAQAALGRLQATSDTPEAREDAAKWLLRAADQGNTQAMQTLGDLYRDHPGMSGDPLAALRWYVQAATAGQPAAARAVAELYARGQGVARDWALALHWYRQAAALGDEPAKFVLGRIEAVTQAVTDNPAQALPWWQNEARKGDLGAALALAMVEAKKRAAQEEPEETVRWSLLLSGLRGAEAWMVRGFMLEHGIAVNRDLVAAKEYYRKAAELGLPQAAAALARLQTSNPESAAKPAPAK